MEDDTSITTARNRVFETKDALSIGSDVSYALHTRETSIYRITGMNQLKDILLCGYVRPRLGKLKGGHINEVFWSKGSNKLYYRNKYGIILEVPSNKLSDNQIGAIPFDDLIGIWQFNDKINRYENKIEFYRKIFNKTCNLELPKTR